MKRIDFDKLEESVIEDWEGGEDTMTYDGDEIEDWSWDDEPDYNEERYGYESPNEELSDHLADCFPTCDSEYQDDEGDYDPLSYVQMGDGKGGIGKRTKAAAYAHNLKGGDYAPTFDDGTVLGGNFDNDDNSDFAMSDDADLDAWAREGKKILENNMNKKLFEEIIDKRPLREAYAEEFAVRIGLKGPDGVTYDQISYADVETDIDYEEGIYGYDSDIRNNVFPMTRAEANALAAEIIENAPAGDVIVSVVPYSAIPNDSTGETMEESTVRARNQLRKVQERVLAKAKSRKLRENEDFDEWDDDDVMTYDDDEMEDWVREGKKISDNRLKEGRNYNRVALRYAKSYEEVYDDDKHNAVAKQVEDVTGLPGWYVGGWGDGAIALVYSGDESDLTPEVVAAARNIFKKAW